MTIFEMSVGGGVLIAVILLLHWRLLYRVPKWTFLLLWAVVLCRLLVPFTVPSQLSVYTGAERVAQALQPEEPPAQQPEVQIPVVLPPTTVPGTLREDSWIPSTPVSPSPAAPAPTPEPVSPLTVVYCTGAALCGLFFAAAYLWSLRRFWDAVPAEQEFLVRWQKEHPTLFPVQIKTCGAVNAPLAYGLVRPVILLPENTDWSDLDQLTYILTHEYVHIRRGDLFWKLLLTTALCVHWFNPLVWAMYFCANRDLELACDEAVVRILGLDNRKGYAYALLAAAESGFMPFCTTYKSKTHMEERIRAIMKIKKKSLAAVLTAALLVVGVTAVFATSKAPEPKKIDDLPQAVMTNTNPKPSGSASAPGEQDNPTTIDRVHPVTGIPNQSIPEQGTDQNPIQGSRWNIPEGPIAAGTKIFAGDEQAKNDLVKYLRKDMGYGGPIAFEHIGDANGGGGTWSVILQENYDGVKRVLEVPKGLTADWTYPVNSKGETYGSAMSEFTVGYLPDLIGVVTSDGVSGYMTSVGYGCHGYPYSIHNPDDAMAYMNWLKAQPAIIKIPVYDVEHNTVLGYYEIENTESSDYVISPERADEILHDLEHGLSNANMTDQEVSQAVLEYKAGQIWKVPADPIPEMTEIRVSTEEELEELYQYLTQVRGIREEDIAKGNYGNGDRGVLITYEQTEREKRLANGYPVNSKGETYGTARDQSFMGYKPDLIGVVATDTGAHGYALKEDYQYFDVFAWAEKNNRNFSGYDNMLKTHKDFNAWASTQPSVKEIPVYDVDRNNILGYFKIYNKDGYDYTISQEEIEWRLNAIADKMREWGNSEEQIARELEEYKASQGWS